MLSISFESFIIVRCWTNECRGHVWPKARHLPSPNAKSGGHRRTAKAGRPERAWLWRSLVVAFAVRWPMARGRPSQAPIAKKPCQLPSPVILFRMNQNISRRSALRKVTGGTVAIAAAGGLSQQLRAAEEAAAPALKGRIHHSVCRWCYGKIPLDELCRAAKQIGIQSIDLMEPPDFPTLKKHGLICAMVTGVPGGIGSGLNGPKTTTGSSLSSRRRRQLWRTRLPKHHLHVRQPERHERRAGSRELRDRR